MYGIPVVQSFIEDVSNESIPNWELGIWEKCWKYFIHKQWMPLPYSWNICQENGVKILR